jgi:lipoate-protein ligase A
MLWRTLLSPPSSAAANMATDAALLDRTRATGEAVLRVYTWRSKTLSLGRHQTAAGKYDLARLAADSYEIVRRPTGGRALIHARELTYSVTMPDDDTRSTSASFRRISSLVADALRRLGVATTAAPRAERATSPGVAPCFDAPAEGELIVDGRKLVASAQLREGGALLQHGSILIDNDQSALTSYSYEPLRPMPAPATLRELLPDRVPSAAALLGAFSAAVAAANGSAPIPLDAKSLDATVVRRHLGQFYDPAWTWRR